MGCLFVIVLGSVSAIALYLLGSGPWVVSFLGLAWLAALVVTAVWGHRGFGGGGNTDIPIVLAGAGIAAAIILPRYTAGKPCNQAKTALKQLATAEEQYYAEHKTYTDDIGSLNLKRNSQVYLVLLRGDRESFMAAASHYGCDAGARGAPQVFYWDSARGGLQ